MHCHALDLKGSCCRLSVCVRKKSNKAEKYQQQTGKNQNRNGLDWIELIMCMGEIYVQAR